MSVVVVVGCVCENEETKHVEGDCESDFQPTDDTGSLLPQT